MKFPAVALLVSPLLALAQSIPVDAIEQIAHRPVDDGSVPGILVGISTPGEPSIFIAYGLSNLGNSAPMSILNCQRIGSITKSFTVTRLLQLADAGLLSLDDPISKYVKGVRNGHATLRELADMTSGIFNYTEDEPFVLDFAFHLTKTWTDRQLVAVANRHKPYFAPGKAWHYSNTNTILLGMVVERVTGHSLRQEITRHIIRPLGLDRTIYPTGLTLPSPFSHGYATIDSDIGRQDVTEVSPSAFSGAGAMASTVGDLLRWGRALARGTLVSGESQLARLQWADSSKGIGPYYDRYGLAMGRIQGWLGHTGDLFGYQSLVMHNLLTGQSVVILVNASNQEHIPTELFEEMAPLLPSAIPSRPVRLKTNRHRTISRSALILRGRAGSPAGILIVQAGARRPFLETHGRESWKTRVHLRPGQNRFLIRATDRYGRSRTQRIVVVRR